MACDTKICKDEFQCKNFGLGYSKPMLFVTSQCGPSILYPIWTIIWLVYRVIWIALDIYWDAERGILPDPMWMAFLTNWSYLLLHIAATWDFVVTHVVQIRQVKSKIGEMEEMPWYLMVNWYLFNTLNSVGVLVTLAFYILLTPSSSPSSINKHAINSVYIILTFFICAKPVRILHFYQPLAFIWLFAIFSVIYQMSTGFIIYPFLDWNNPGIAVAYGAVMSLVGIPLIHLMFYGFYHLRTYIYSQCCERRPIVENKEVVDLEKF